MVLVASAASFTAAVEAAPHENDDPVANPDLPRGCGIDILMVLDESGSVKDFTDNVTGRLSGLHTGDPEHELDDGGDRVLDRRQVAVARCGVADDYTQVTNATIASVFDPYINNNYDPSGSTHWEDAFRVGRYFLPASRSDQAAPDRVHHRW